MTLLFFFSFLSFLENREGAHFVVTLDLPQRISKENRKRERGDPVPTFNYIYIYLLFSTCGAELELELELELSKILHSSDLS